MLLHGRFPELNQVTLTARDVDVWQPKHLQLESLGLLRNFSNVSDLQNTDPDLDALKDWLQKLHPLQDHMHVNLQSLEEFDFTITTQGIAHDCDVSEVSSVCNESSDEEYVPTKRYQILTLCVSQVTEPTTKSWTHAKRHQA